MMKENVSIEVEMILGKREKWYQILPCIPVQEVFDLRQLWVNAFCNYDLKNTKSFFFLHQEGITKKGPNEIGSFLNKFFEDYYVRNNIKELHIFTNGCLARIRIIL